MQIQSVWETQKGNERESHLCSGSGADIEDCGLVYMCTQASRSQMRVQVLFLGAGGGGGLGVEMLNQGV